MKTRDMKSVFAVCIGASTGALLRWWMSLVLNPKLSLLPLGTLVANLGGSYLIGVALAFFSHDTSLSPHWRHLIVTGFLGGLTTFSTFSAEIAFAIRQERLFNAAIILLSHVIGAVLMTLLGIFSFELWRKL